MLETHYEGNLLINNRELKHKGLFIVDEVFQTLNRALEEQGYTKREKKTEETLTAHGRQTLIELRPYKEKTNYVLLMQKIRINIHTEKETVSDIKGYKQKFQEGEITFIFDAWMLTDNENRWGMRPLFFFAKSMIHKFLYPLPLEEGFRDEVVSDTAHIYTQLRKLFHSYQPAQEALPSEEDVKSSVEKFFKRGSPVNP